MQGTHVFPERLETKAKIKCHLENIQPPWHWIIKKVVFLWFYFDKMSNLAVKTYFLICIVQKKSNHLNHDGNE